MQTFTKLVFKQIKEEIPRNTQDEIQEKSKKWHDNREASRAASTFALTIYSNDRFSVKMKWTFERLQAGNA